MKAFYFFVGTWCLCFAGITAFFVAQEQDVYLLPVEGQPQAVQSLRYLPGIQATTQVSTDRGDYRVLNSVEIPRGARVLVRTGRTLRWLCLAPDDGRSDAQALPCWRITSRSAKETSP